jgi:hypothetical protein
MLSPIHQSLLRELNTSLNALEDDASVMVLCNGKLPDGPHFYAFVNIAAAKLVAFYDAIREGKQVKLGEYGEVIASGEGVEPPADVRSKMEAEYNLDYGLGEKLRYLFQV